MRNVTISFKATAMAFAYMLAGLTPVYGDDIDIFTGGEIARTVAPNIMFIIDTSGSMKEEVAYTENGVQKSKQRIAHVKDATKKWLATAENVNVGLMRFSNPGGPVLYPVSYIDQPLSSIGDITTVSRRIASGNDDGFEFNTSKTVVLDRDVLQIADNVSSTKLETISIKIASSSDDAEQSLGSSGSTTTNSPLLTGGYLDTPSEDGTRQAIGLRFNGISIPKASTIISATFDFVVRAQPSNTSPLHVLIKGETGNSPLTFSNTTANDVNGRTLTSAEAIWESSDIIPNADVQSSADFANVVQEMVNDTNWLETNNSMVFVLKQDPNFMTDTTANRGFRRYYTYDSGNTQQLQPKLNIAYQNGSGTTDSTTVGLRFSDLAIPKGVEIKSAKLRFTANSANLSNTANLEISAENIGDSPAFDTTNNNFGSRDKTTPVSWTPADWLTPDNTEESIDLTDTVKKITDRSDWCGGNAMSFFITGTGERFAKAFEKSSVDAPLLEVTYTTSSVDAGNSCRKQQFVRQVNNSSDDAEESGSTTGLTSQDLEFMIDGSNTQDIGVRFNNIKIPKGATIKAAYLEFVAKENSSGSPSITIYGHKTGISSQFSTADGSVSNRLSSGNRTSSSVSWSPEAWTLDNTYRTSNIASIVQEIVNLDDWAVGNSMTLLFKGTTSKRSAYTYDGSKAKAPKLIIEFVDDGSVNIEPTVRDELISLIDGLSPGGYTPLQDVLYEAALYYRGENVVHGLKRGGPNDSGPFAYTRLSSELAIDPGTYTLNRPSSCTTANLDADACKTETLNSGARYKSPIADACAANYTVLLTDGIANRPHSEDAIRNLIGSGDPASVTCKEASGGAGTCGPELANFMKTIDQNNSLPNNQTVITHTIGFNINNDWLNEVASSGGGQFFSVENGDDLSKAFETITVTALDKESTFVTPVAAVNAFNRVFTRDELYYSVFSPGDKSHWIGNLKRYRLDTDLDILDSENKNAVGADGRFTSDSKSFWSNSVDGNTVAKGGAAGEITDHTTRTIYTYLGDYSGSLTLSNFSTSNSALTGSTTLFNAVTSGLTNAQLIDWARGADIADIDGNGITTETRSTIVDSNGNPKEGASVIGDPLHSGPVAITYGGDENNPDITLFMTTNAGFLHAFDNTDGSEVFSFIPQELIKNLDKMYRNSSGEHIYGLDSPITSWIIDKDRDTQIETADNDKVYLFFGMRRGGRNYYAMDVTDRNNPKLIWTIRGGEGNFAELGQSWAQPLLTKIRYNNGTSIVTVDALILSGGYDETQDDDVKTKTDSYGNAIFIVNALDGSLIWKGSLSGTNGTEFSAMKYSIPAQVANVDTDDDGITNLMFVGDMGGQLWRFDIMEGATVDNLVKGGVIASLGEAETLANNGTPSAINSRRFYEAPDVGIGKDKNGKPYAAIVFGSGWRESPLNTQTQDRFYMVKQFDVFKAPSSYTVIKESDLYNATDDKISSSNTSEKTAALDQLNQAKGWYIDLPNAGEKLFNEPRIYAGVVRFTTFEPTASIVDCLPSPGTNRSYAISALNASGSVNWGTAVDPGSHGRAGKTSNFGYGGNSKISFRMIDGKVQVSMPETATKIIELPKPGGDDDTTTFWIEE